MSPSGSKFSTKKMGEGEILPAVPLKLFSKNDLGLGDRYPKNAFSSEFAIAQRGLLESWYLIHQEVPKWEKKK